jgi:hypothetical protein
MTNAAKKCSYGYFTVKKTRQGVRDLNGPALDGKQMNQLPVQRSRNVKFCRHVDVRVDNKGELYSLWSCKTCGAVWEDSGFGYPGDPW